MATVQDVAREAGVSTATVSRALNDKASVDPKLKRRVIRAASRLGYRPNAAARNLRRQRTSLWALIISDIGNPFFTALARGVEDVAQDSGFSVLLCNADEDPSKEQQYLDIAVQEQVAGVILSPHTLRTKLTEPLGSTIPVVAVDRRLESGSDAVLVDSRDGARRATTHLLDSGWSRPAFISGPEDRVTSAARTEGYLQALGSDHIAIVEPGAFKAEGGRTAAAALLDRADPPDSILVTNSVVCLGVLEELRSRSLRVGRDIGLITFDDAPWAPLVDPPVSVVAQPAYEIGARAARILGDRISGTLDGVRQDVVLGTTLIVRESSRRRA